MSRSLGWTLLTTRSPIAIVPEVMFSRPASIRSKVDLPHPEGPTRTTNSPSSIGIVTPCRTSKLPNDFRTSRIWTDDIHFPPWWSGGIRRTPPPPHLLFLARFFIAGLALTRGLARPALSAVYTVLAIVRLAIHL